MKHFHRDQPRRLEPDHWTSTEAVYQSARKVLISVLFAFFCGYIEPPAAPDLPSTEDQLSAAGLQTYHPISTFTILASTSPGEVLARPRDATRTIAALQWLIRYTVWGHIQITRAGLKNPPRLLDDVEKQSGLWLRELKQTVFSWLRNIMHIGTHFVMTDAAIGRFTYVGDDTFIIDGQAITVTAWRNMVKTLMQELQEKFSALCEFVGIAENELELPVQPYDHNTCETVDYWFGTEKSNMLYDPIQSFAKKALSSRSIFQSIGHY